MPPSVRDLPLAELRSVKGNDVADVQAIRAALASTVLTKGAGVVYGDRGFFQNEIDLSVRDERKPLGFADVSHCGGLPSQQKSLQRSMISRRFSSISDR